MASTGGTPVLPFSYGIGGGGLGEFFVRVRALALCPLAL